MGLTSPGGSRSTANYSPGLTPSSPFPSTTSPPSRCRRPLSTPIAEREGNHVLVDRRLVGVLLGEFQGLADGLEVVHPGDVGGGQGQWLDRFEEIVGVQSTRPQAE